MDLSAGSRRVPLDKRKRTETSCDRCKARKQKCDRLLNQEQCRYCELHDLECTTTAPRKKRAFGYEGVGTRISLLESLVKGLLPEADLTSIGGMQQIGTSLGIPLPPLQDNDSVAEPAPAGADGSSKDDDDDEDNSADVIPDQQNQIQYVGPSSSFLFHLKLRRMLGGYSVFKFALFGNNAADQIVEAPVRAIQSDRQQSHHNVDATAAATAIGERRESSSAGVGMGIDCSSPSDAVREIDGPVIEALMDAYFDVIHPDFPVLHEASFRERYEVWSTCDTTAEPAWLCSALCVLILSRRVAALELPDEAEKKWWRHVQTLLPTVIFSSNTATVQALMLAALHLHNNNHRDACWNLTGTAVRVAHAIGMHRGDDIKHIQGRLNREVRKQLWWTLYAFEQMQVSSYDRPSAIAMVSSTVDCPNERILGTAGPFSPDFARWSRKLLLILAKACQALDPAGTRTRGVPPPPEDAYNRPLSPTATILRDLERWEKEIPVHLRLDGLTSLAPTSQRPLILLHIQYHYILVLVTRAALLRRATLIARSPAPPDPSDSVSLALTPVSETSISAGRSLGRLLRKLDAIHHFNAVTWFDVFYLVQAALVLVLDLHIRRGESGGSTPSLESRTLLQDLAALATRHMRNPRMPGTMRALAQIVVDVNSTAEQFAAPVSVPMPVSMPVPMPISMPMSVPVPVPVQAQGPADQPLAETETETDETAAFQAPRDTSSIRDYTFDSGFLAQLSFMDEQAGSISQDWVWEDIGSIVRGG